MGQWGPVHRLQLKHLQACFTQKHFNCYIWRHHVLLHPIPPLPHAMLYAMNSFTCTKLQSHKPSLLLSLFKSCYCDDLNKKLRYLIPLLLNGKTKWKVGKVNTHNTTNLKLESKCTEKMYKKCRHFIASLSTILSLLPIIKL